MIDKTEKDPAFLEKFNQDNQEEFDMFGGKTKKKKGYVGGGFDIGGPNLFDDNIK